MLKLKGKMFEIGNLEDDSGRGMRLESDGDDFSIIGMTEDECRSAAQWFGDTVEITICGADVVETETQNHPRTLDECARLGHENSALRAMLQEWFDLFAPMRVAGTEGARLIDRTETALTTEFRYKTPNVK